MYVRVGSVREFVFYVFFFKIQKNVTFYVFFFVACVLSNNNRQCLLHLEVYQIASLHCAL